MKIRTGFVSNSSSSSFCIYGMYVDTATLEQAAKVLQVESSECEKSKKYPIDNIYEVTEYLEEKTELVYRGPSEGEERCIGLPPECIKDDETGKEFKDRVAGLLQAFAKEGGIDINNPKCSWHTEGWYD